jgi:bifunctional DNA-binding transcriptional regulator/antitoxin component of YhaV-PrlF toxin-antitoxin module
MEQADMRVVGKCFGSAVVGPRGQMVIPVEARRELGMEVGTRVLVFKLFQGRGLAFVKVEAVEDLLRVITQHVDEFTKLIREIKTGDVANEANRD